ncbi:MAG: hypothetical protein WAN65_19275, partial [Candidatus Sulfotelmatobacter sp.]
MWHTTYTTDPNVSWPAVNRPGVASSPPVVRTHHASSPAAMEAAFERVVPAQGVNPMSRCSEHAPSLVRQSSYRGVRSYGTSPRCLLGNAAHGAA